MEHGGSEIAAGVREGQVLAGKYRVERVLGVGGMGVVVAAHHLQLETKVALKFLMPDMLANDEAVGRFAREARAAAKITNEHVARVIDVGTLENGAPYMVMEYLEGTDLRERLISRGPLEVEETVELVLQACEALSEAHGLGIVHRDLKPANLFCVSRSDGFPCVKVLDFGISKFSSGTSSGPAFAMTRTATTMGSPFYMSPEQMESARAVDARTDLWALGVVIHELLAGEPPFTGESLPEVCLKIASKPAPPIRSLRADVPEGLERVILRCLEKDRDNRYPSVSQLAVDLVAFGPPRSISSVERITRTMRPPGFTSTSVAPVFGVGDGYGSRPRFGSSPGETLLPLEHTKREFSRKSKFVTLVVGVVGLAVSILVIAAFAKRERPDLPSPAASGTSAAAEPLTVPSARAPSLAPPSAVPSESPPPRAPVPPAQPGPPAQPQRPGPSAVAPSAPIRGPGGFGGRMSGQRPSSPKDVDPFSRLPPPL